MYSKKLLIFLCIPCAPLLAISQDDQNDIFSGTKMKCSGFVETSSKIIELGKKIPVYERIGEQHIVLDFTLFKDTLLSENQSSNNLLVMQCFAKPDSSTDKAECAYLSKTYNSKLEKFVARKTHVSEKFKVLSKVNYIGETKTMEVTQVESQTLKNEKKYNNIKIGRLDCKLE
jgi:hypothetical protein